jgi:hypothetical protein
MSPAETMPRETLSASKKFRFNVIFKRCAIVFLFAVGMTCFYVLKAFLDRAPDFICVPHPFIIFP